MADLAPAGETSWEPVHVLLAEREIAVRNGDDTTQIDAALADLGFTV